MPILGIVASSISGNLGAFESIQSVPVTTATGLITFSNIPSTYASLQVRVFARGASGGNQAYQMYFNNDTTLSNYAYHCMGGDGSAFTQSVLGQAHVGSCRENAWNVTVIDIPDYTNTSKAKVRNSFSGSMSQTDGSVFYYGSIWNNTTAVNRIDLTHTSGANFITGSVFALYGLKGA